MATFNEANRATGASGVPGPRTPIDDTDDALARLESRWRDDLGWALDQEPFDPDPHRRVPHRAPGRAVLPWRWIALTIVLLIAISALLVTTTH